MTDIRNVTVLGTGVLGSQIIMQAAYHRMRVTAYDISDDVLARLPDRWEWMRGYYERDLDDFDPERFDRAVDSIATTTDLVEAVADADVVIEAIPEVLELKQQVWARVGEAAPDKTIFLTNTSSLLPSDFADATGRPEKFLTLHFANLVWSHNTGEVMMTPKTDRQYFDTVIEFAGEIGLEPIPVRIETPGYLLNGLLIPWLQAAAALYIDGVGDPDDIDKAWRIAVDAPKGPFEIYDVVGFNVAYHVSKASDDERVRRFADKLQEGIDAGRTGLGDREGFFTYDADGNRQELVETWRLPE